MRTNAIIKLVYNRKKKKLKPDEKALVQIEVIFKDRKQMFISSGIYLKTREWDKTAAQVTGCTMAPRLNKLLNDKITAIRIKEIQLNEQGYYLTADAIKEALTGEHSQKSSFTQFMTTTINHRSDLCQGSRYTHLRAVEYLKESGIERFSDLSILKINDFNNLLKQKKLTQTSISKLNQVVKTYINRAVDLDLMRFEDNPYRKIKIPRGKHEIRIRLDDTEIEAIMNYKTDNPVLQLVSELFKFQILTGLAYKDLRSLTSISIRHNKDGSSIEGLRKKTGEYYNVPLLPEAVLILDKYCPKEGPVFPAPEQHIANRYLKVIADACGISKKLTTHVGRHTFASWALRNDISLSAVRDLLGHASTRYTEIYARLEQESLRKEMQKLVNNKGRC